MVNSGIFYAILPAYYHLTPFLRFFCTFLFFKYFLSAYSKAALFLFNFAVIGISFKEKLRVISFYDLLIEIEEFWVANDGWCY